MKGYDIHPGNRLNVGRTERILSIVGGIFGLLWLLPRASKLKAPTMLSSGYMIYRGVTGKCTIYEAMGIERTGNEGEAGVRVRRAMTVNRRREEVYSFWRNFENLPRFMKHLESVQTLDEQRSHWTALGPLGIKVEWDAEIIEDKPNEKISWRSLPGSTVFNAGSVIFLDAPNGRGTEIQITIQYDPPAGSAGAAIAKLLGKEPTVQVLDDLRRFKQVMEAGEIATTWGQTSGRFEDVQTEREELMARQGQYYRTPEGEWQPLKATTG